MCWLREYLSCFAGVGAAGSVQWSYAACREKTGECWGHCLNEGVGTFLGIGAVLQIYAADGKGVR